MQNIQKRNVRNEFTFGKKIGSGAFGCVYLAKDRKNGASRVVKVVDRRNANVPLSTIHQEFSLLKGLDHPTIQRVYDIFEDPVNVYIVAEPYSGGNLISLFDKAVRNRIQVTVEWLTKIVEQMIQGVAHLHGKHILHCDLKEDNIMIATDTHWHAPSVRIIDFGLAQHFKSNTFGLCGTPGYIPPEVYANQPWTQQGDVHSLGVVMFQLFAGGQRCYTAYGGVNAWAMATRTQVPNFGLVDKYAGLRDLLTPMLHKNFKHRPMAAACLKYQFFNTKAANHIAADVVAAMKAIGEQITLQKVVMADMADRMNLGELEEINHAFMALHHSHGLDLSKEDVRRALRAHFDDEILERVLHAIADRHGRVKYTNFMGAVLSAKKKEQEHMLRLFFHEVDKDGNHVLSRSEVKQMLAKPNFVEALRGRRVDDIMRGLDENRDGNVTLEEFLHAVSGRKVR